MNNVGVTERKEAAAQAEIGYHQALVEFVLPRSHENLITLRPVNVSDISPNILVVIVGSNRLLDLSAPIEQSSLAERISFADNFQIGSGLVRAIILGNRIFINEKMLKDRNYIRALAQDGIIGRQAKYFFRTRR